ncbi:hypothetical protein GGX14DRAFT_388037 [Mycena pura]|uniref:Uncharacterized protein n=1 Tax=Mycena pura TaxID=153505 RepID=A0AAD6VTA5_9AGAR|nr:hypothetical protein GGX14DRAFT_388037 [Mycena pura]
MSDICCLLLSPFLYLLSGSQVIPWRGVTRRVGLGLVQSHSGGNESHFSTLLSASCIAFGRVMATRVSIFGTWNSIETAGKATHFYIVYNHPLSPFPQILRLSRQKMTSITADVLAIVRWFYTRPLLLRWDAPGWMMAHADRAEDWVAPAPFNAWMRFMRELEEEQGRLNPPPVALTAHPNSRSRRSYSTSSGFSSRAVSLDAGAILAFDLDIPSMILRVESPPAPPETAAIPQETVMSKSCDLAQRQRQMQAGGGKPDPRIKVIHELYVGGSLKPQLTALNRKVDGIRAHKDGDWDDAVQNKINYGSMPWRKDRGASAAQGHGGGGTQAEMCGERHGKGRHGDG